MAKKTSRIYFAYLVQHGRDVQNTLIDKVYSVEMACNVGGY